MSYTERTANWVIAKAYLHGRHKAAPAQTDTKYQLLLSIVDSAQQDWASEPGIEWNSLYQKINIGNVSATDTFDLDDEIQYISKREGDYIYLQDFSGRRMPVPLVTGDQLYLTRDILTCAQINRSLVFSKAFTTDSPYLGYSIIVPSITYVDDVTSANSLIQCDDPLYLALMVAAEDIREDVVLQNQYNNLLDKASERMSRMKQNNVGQNEQVVRSSSVYGESWI